MDQEELARIYGTDYAFYRELIEPINIYGCLRWLGKPKPKLWTYNPITQRRASHRTTPAKLAYYVEYNVFHDRVGTLKLCNTPDCIAPAHRTTGSVGEGYRGWEPAALIHGRTITINGETYLEKNPCYPNAYERRRLSSETTPIVIVHDPEGSSMVEPAPAPLAPAAAPPPSAQGARVESDIQIDPIAVAIIRQQENETAPRLAALIHQGIASDLEAHFRRARALDEEARREEIRKARPRVDPRMIEAAALPEGFTVVATSDVDGPNESWILRFTIEACAAPAPLRLCKSFGEEIVPDAAPGTVMYGVIFPETLDLIIWSEDSIHIMQDDDTKHDILYTYSWLSPEAHTEAKAFYDELSAQSARVG